MSVSDTTENTILDDIFNGASDPWIALHTGNPGETGANEVTGGSYGRQQVAFDPASGGSVQNSGQVDFTGIANGTTIVAWSAWTASSGGTCRWIGWKSTVARLFVVRAADLTANDITSPSHGFTNDDRWVAETVEGLALPAGITAGTLYWVLATTTDTFTISTTQDGSAVDITGSGVGIGRLIVPSTVSTGQTYRIAAGGLVASLD